METRMYGKYMGIYQSDRKEEPKIKKAKADQKTDTKVVTSGWEEKEAVMKLSEDWKEHADWKKMVDELFDVLEKSYPDIKITVLSERYLSSDELRKTAFRMGKGKHLLLSQKLIDKMSSSAKNFEYYKKFLEESCQQMSSGTEKTWASGMYLSDKTMRYWMIENQEEEKKSITARLETMRSEQTAWEKNQNKKFKTKYAIGNAAYDTAGKYIKMARAGNRQQVQSVLGEVNQSISALRLASCLGDNSERQRAALAIRSLQKLIWKGRKKIKRFDAETVMKRRQKKAEEERMERKAEQIRQEIRKNRTKRYQEDKQMEKEGKEDQAQIEQLMRQYEAECARMQMGIGQEGAGVLPAEAGGDVMLSPAVEIGEIGVSME